MGLIHKIFINLCHFWRFHEYRSQFTHIRSAHVSWIRPNMFRSSAVGCFNKRAVIVFTGNTPTWPERWADTDPGFSTWPSPQTTPTLSRGKTRKTKVASCGADAQKQHVCNAAAAEMTSTRKHADRPGTDEPIQHLMTLWPADQP